MKLIAAALLLAAPAQVAPPGDAFCADLQRLSAAAEETPAFASMGGANLIALLQSYCPVPAGAIAFLCTRSLTPPEIGAASLVERMNQCLPGLAISVDSGYRESTVEHGRLRIEISESGGPGAHVGTTVTLYISAR